MNYLDVGAVRPSGLPPILYYIHDPMCSWCWGFRPVWSECRLEIGRQFPQVRLEYLAGGLAPDSDIAMPEAMKHALQMTWRRIQQAIPGTVFNSDFWRVCSPRRSTYPACRAVLAAKQLNAAAEEAMILSIQRAYYTQARNPSDADVLMDCARAIGLDVAAFEKVWLSEDIEDNLQSHITRYRQLASYSGASGFPSVVFVYTDKRTRSAVYKNIPIDYNDASVSLRAIATCFSAVE